MVVVDDDDELFDDDVELLFDDDEGTGNTMYPLEMGMGSEDPGGQ